MPAYDLTLTMLSPVHVGTGEELSPDEYVVVDGRDADDQVIHRLHAIDVPRFLAGMDPALHARFDEAVAASSLTMLRKLLAGSADLARHTRWRAATSEEVFHLYRDGLAKATAELAVHPMTRTGLNGQPYIPGSSIKGAIRTAILQAAVDARPGRADTLARTYASAGPRAAVKLEADILGYLRPGGGRPEIRADPFRAVRITDCPLDEEATSIDPVELHSLKRGAARRASDPSGIHLFYEMTFSALDDQDVRARGRLEVDARLAGTSARQARGWDFDRCVSRPITADEILNACREFYIPRLDEEARRFGGLRPAVRDSYDRLAVLAGHLADHETIIRLGRFSHVECVTLAPPLRKAPGGSSRGLAVPASPMGWVKLGLR